MIALVVNNLRQQSWTCNDTNSKNLYSYCVFTQVILIRIIEKSEKNQNKNIFILVEISGLEPLTSALQGQRSTN